MLLEIESYLKDTFSPETVRLFNKGFTLFDDFLTEDYQSEYLDALMYELAPDTPSVQDRFNIIFIRQLKDLVGAHEITLSEDATVSDYVETLDFLSLVQDWEDCENLTSIIDASISPIDAFCDLFEHIKPDYTDKVHTFVDDVPASLVAKLKGFLEESNKAELVQEEIEEAPDQAFITRLRILSDFMQAKEFKSYALVAKGTFIGASFKMYFEMLKNELAAMDQTQFTKEWLFISYMSKDASVNPMLFFRENSNELIGDILAITAIDIKLSKLIDDFMVVYGAYLRGAISA
jgi:hypothetical protein